MTDPERTAFETKIRADFLFLKLLVDDQTIKPGHEVRIYSRLADTVRDFPHLFPENESGNETSKGPTETHDRE